MKINLKHLISIFDQVKIIIAGNCTKVRVIWLSNKNYEKSCSDNIFRPKTLDLVSTYIYVFISFVYYYSTRISIILATIIRKVFIVLISIKKAKIIQHVENQFLYTRTIIQMRGRHGEFLFWRVHSS